MSGIANVVQLILLLDSTDTLLSSRELASELEVSERQVRNYIQVLREQGIEIEGDQAGGGGYSGRKMGLKIPWRMQEKELHALISAVKRLEHDDMYMELSDLKSLSLKLMSRMKSECLNHRIEYRDRITGVHHERECEWIAQIDEAIQKQNKVKVVYQSSNSKTTKERIVHPYALEGYHHGMYMKGFCEEAADYRTFKLNRIQNLERLDKMYEPMKQIEEQAKEKGFGIFRQEEYVLVADFSYPFNTYIQEVQLGDGQRFDILDEDTTRITVTLDNRYEAVTFLMGFGSKVKVIKPELIRDEIISEAKKIVAMSE
jgi:predicted DNA-binding transcriptional regulator YafY